MRKAARKQKKLEKAANNAQKSSIISKYEIPPCAVLEVFTNRQRKFDEIDRIVLNSIDEIKEFAGAVADNTTLQTLKCQCDSDLINYLAEAFKYNTSVTVLQLSNLTWIDKDRMNDLLEHVGTLMNNSANLQTLSMTAVLIMSDQVTSAVSFGRFVAGLKSNTTLTALTVPALAYQDNHVDQLIEAINEHPKLVDLTFHNGCTVSLNAMRLMSKLIASNRLKKIYFEPTRGFPGSYLSFLEALKESTSLTDLSMAKLNQRWGTSNFNQEEIELLCDALKINKTLTRLNLNGNRIGPQNTSKILDALQHNNTMTELNFWDNDLNSGIAPSIACLLEINESLTELDLPNAHLTDLSCQIIAPALMKNRTITSLNLFMNNIGSEGSKALAEGLKFNKVLIRINLKNCQISDEGCIYLGEAIKTNQCLLHLDISGQDIKTNGFKALVGGLQENGSLTDLTVSKDKSVPKELYEELITLQNKNKQYQRELIVNTITMLIQIARSDAFDLFPLEIWLRIFKHFICGGVPGFNNIAQSILMHSDVRDLQTLCKMKIVRINGRSHLVAKKAAK
jgi:Ran GTPase-activating protein (RanGAP) involved in mRNA processing and transport